MGYSTPKKQLDLREFLSQPAKKLPVKRFDSRKAPMKPAQDAKVATQGKEKDEN